MPDQVYVAGQVLTAAQQTTLQTNIGLTFITAETIGTTQTSITMSNVFSATFDNYKITISGGTTNTDDQGFGVRLGGEITNYYVAQTGSSYAGADNNTSTNGGSSWATVGRLRTNGNNLNIEVHSPYLSKISYIYGTSVNLGTSRSFGGYLNTTASYTAFTVLVEGGDNMTGGTIRVYGYRNS